MAKKTGNQKKQTFQIQAPGATSVILVGDFTNWQSQGISMQKGHNGLWTASLELPAGHYHYRFIVDNEWKDDPECSLRVSNPYGGQNMVRHVA